MTDYPYSEQIFQKVLKDWSNIPFEELKIDSVYVSHPSVNYRLQFSNHHLYPEKLLLAIEPERAWYLFDNILEKPMKAMEKQRAELTVKQFLGLE